MDLRITDDLFNSLILLPDDSPLYNLQTDHKWFSTPPTIIKKFVGSSVQDMAVLSLPYGLGAKTLVEVWGRDITPRRERLFSPSETFVASDGKSYKWKIEIASAPYLVSVSEPGSSGSERSCIASFDRGSLGLFGKPRLPTLTVAPQGMHIGDDIVATLICVLQHEEHRKRQARRHRRH